jgi:methylated-DNA-protein-cysteine methyltransferase-like protein
VEDFTRQAIARIKRIPQGKVATYGQIARLAGNPRGARQVVRILNVYSDKEKLPWHRVINREGRISLPSGRGYELQKSLLEDEGVQFDRGDVIDLKRFLWKVS